MALIFYLSGRPDLPNPYGGWQGQLLSSGAHILVFGVLALLWARVLRNQRYGWLAAFVLTMLYAVSDEYHQSFVPGRHADLWDLLCDGLGAVLALVLWAVWNHRGRRWTGGRA
jgi:VanZ family protein